MAARTWTLPRARTIPVPRPGRAAHSAHDGARASPPAAPGWAWGVAVAVVALLFHAWGAGEVAGDKDSSEFTLVLARLGLAHPTGYPLYTVGGHAWGRVLHALGVEWPRAAAWWSALGGAVAIGALHAVAARLLARAGLSPGGAAAGALLPVAVFGANPVWTLEATVAEVGAWHVAWVTLAVGAALALEHRPRGAWHAATLGALLGAGLGHHLSSLLWSVPLGAWMLSRFARGDRRRRVTFVLGFLAAPLAGLGFLAWQAAHPGDVHWPLLGSGGGAFWDHVTGGPYRHYLGRFAPSPAQALLFTSYVLPSLVLAVAALVALAARPGPPRAGGGAVVRAILAGALLQTAFAFAYGVPDPTSYFLPVLAIGLAAAPAAVVAWVPATKRRGAWAMLAAGVLIAAIVPRWIGIAGERRETFARFDTLLRSMWTRIPDEPGFVLWGDDMAWRLRQYQLLDGLGRALVVVDPVLLRHPVARERFTRAHGFDPLAGVALPPLDDPLATAALTDAVARAIDARTPLPVYLFAPQGPSVRRLVKPAP